MSKPGDPPRIRPGKKVLGDGRGHRGRRRDRLVDDPTSAPVSLGEKVQGKFFVTGATVNGTRRVLRDAAERVGTSRSLS